MQRSTFAFLTLATGVAALASADPSSMANATSGPHVGVRGVDSEPQVARARLSTAGEGGESGAAGAAGVGGEAGETGGAADEAGGAGWSAAEPAVGRAPAELDDEAAEFGGGAELALVSRSIWRGMALSSGASVEPAAWASYAGITATIWASLPLTHDASRHGVNAFEPELSYDASWGPLRLEPRVTLLWMHDRASASLTTEVGLEAILAVYGPVSLVNSHHLDVMQTKGAYYGTLGPRVDQYLGRLHFSAFFATGYASAAYNGAYFDVSRAAFDLLEAGLVARFELEHSLFLEANAGLSTLLPDALRATTSEPTLSYVGVAFGFDR